MQYDQEQHVPVSICRVTKEEDDPAAVQALFRAEDDWAYLLSFAKLAVSPFKV